MRDTWYYGIVLVALSPPATNDRSPRYMEKALAAIHQGLPAGEPVVLAFGPRSGQVAWLVRFAERYEQRVIGPILANYPQAAVGTCSEPAAPTHEWSADLMLAPHLFPILRHGQFEDLLARRYADPIDSLLQALHPGGGIECRVELELTPASPHHRKAAQRAVSLLDRSFFRRHRRLASFFAEHAASGRWKLSLMVLERLAGRSTAPDRAVPLDLSASRYHEREADLQAAADKVGGHLFTARLRIVAAATSKSPDAAVERIRTIAGALGALTRSRLARFQLSAIRPGNPIGSGPAFLLSHEEIATLWHPPTEGVATENLAVASFIERPAPANLPTGNAEGDIILGRVRHRSDSRSVGLRRDDRRRHVYVVGKTGMGKSTLLLNQIGLDLQAGRGLCLIDPHGDLAETALGLVPPERTNDVIVFDAGDRQYAIGFNPLACPDPSRTDQVAGGVVAALRKLYDSWGPRLEDTLRNGVHATVEQGGTLLSLLQLLGDSAYRERVVPRIRDPLVRSFWQHEFATWSKAYRTEAVAAIQNKIRPFLTNTIIRAIVAQSGPGLDLRQVMDDRKVLLVNLSKGRIGEDNSSLLGALLVTSLQQAAMMRADVPEEKRCDFGLYVDEFQNFTSGSFATILSEARKYRLGLTVSHQYLSQLDEATTAAVAGNVGTIVAFAVGIDDAEWLAGAMSKSPGQLAPQELAGLPKYTACVRLLVDGLPSDPFTMTTFPPPPPDEERRRTIIRQSQRQFARPAADVLRHVSGALTA